MGFRRLVLVAVVVVVAALSVPEPAAAAVAGRTALVSVSATGVQGDSASFWPALSGDGRYVAFSSAATNLAADDTNVVHDVFVRDLRSRTTERISVAPGGGDTDNYSQYPAISRDGRFVAFTSAASNLVGGDTNGRDDVFVRDRATATTTRVSVTSTGDEAHGTSTIPVISADGRYIAFHSDAANLAGGDANGTGEDVFVHDRVLGTTAVVSVALSGIGGDGPSRFPSISDNGRYVAFVSTATDLVPDRGADGGVFVRDLWSGTTTRASLTSVGTPAARASTGMISGNGRYVSFETDASDVVPGDTNGMPDSFVRDLATARTTRISVASDGTQANESSLVRAFSADGRYIALESSASNLSVGDRNGLLDVFVHDQRSGTTRLVSVSRTGSSGDLSSFTPAISADGRSVAFCSGATDLVPADANGAADIFLRFLGHGQG